MNLNRCTCRILLKFSIDLLIFVHIGTKKKQEKNVHLLSLFILHCRNGSCFTSLFQLFHFLPIFSWLFLRFILVLLLIFCLPCHHRRWQIYLKWHLYCIINWIWNITNKQNISITYTFRVESYFYFLNKKTDLKSKHLFINNHNLIIH